MNIVRTLAATLALVSTLAVVPGVAQASEGRRPRPPVTMERDGDHRGDHDDVRWGYDRDGHWGRFERDHRRDFDRDWIG
jgi:hypothetical protein